MLGWIKAWINSWTITVTGIPIRIKFSAPKLLLMATGVKYSQRKMNNAARANPIGMARNCASQGEGSFRGVQFSSGEKSVASGIFPK